MEDKDNIPEINNPPAENKKLSINEPENIVGEKKGEKMEGEKDTKALTEEEMKKRAEINKQYEENLEFHNKIKEEIAEQMPFITEKMETSILVQEFSDNKFYAALQVYTI